MVQFVAVTVGTGAGAAATSPDGVTWTARTLPAGTNWLVANCGTQYIAVARGSANAATSPDGITWTARTLPASSNWYGLAWNGSVFCVVSSTGVYCTSADGITWSTGTAGTGTLSTLAWNGSIFLAAGFGGTVTSPDGITWTQRTSLGSINVWTGAIAVIGSTFFVGGYNGNIYRTTDGITWLSSASGLGAVVIRGIAWNGTTLCVIDGVSANCATSPDGITWTSHTTFIAPTGGGAGYKMAWNGSVFCAIVYNNGAALGSAVTSPDGITWTARSMPSASTWNSIVGVNLASTDSTGTSSSTLENITATGSANNGTNSSSASIQGIAASGSAITIHSGDAFSSVLVSPLVSSSAIKSGIAASTAATLTSQVGTILAFPVALSTMATTTTCQAPTIFWEVVTSSGVMAGSIVAQRVMDGQVSNSLLVTQLSTGQASYHVSAESMAKIIDGVLFIQKFWDGWATNLNTGAPSFYENFKFNSFARIGNQYYGCSDAGIFLLGADNDAGLAINATITTGTSDLSTESFDGAVLKTVPAVYVDSRSVSPMTLTCRVEGQEFTYTVNSAKATVGTARVDPGKGLKGTYWQFELKNVGGADFDLDSFKVLPHATKRRV